MCLTTIQQKPIITRKEKVVYKILHKERPGVFKALFYDFFYFFNILNESVIREQYCFTGIFDGAEVLEIHNGFHSYIKKPDYSLYVNSAFYKDTVIIKCIIPKGSKIYYGSNNGYFSKIDGIVSNYIIIKEECV